MALMSRINRKYWLFYVMGREANRLPRSEVEVKEGEIAKAILAQDAASIREAIVDACRAAAGTVITERRKKNWLKAHEEDLKAFGDAHPSEAWSRDEAYEAWLTGRLDHLAYALEPEVVFEMANEVFEGESEDGK
jgi:hypothetical protein